MRLATSSADKTIRLWQMDSSTSLAKLKTGESGASWMQWSPDGRYVAFSTQSIGIELYRTQGQDLIDLACRAAVRNMSEAEWQEYIGNQRPYNVTCAGKPIPGKSYPRPELFGQRG